MERPSFNFSDKRDAVAVCKVDSVVIDSRPSINAGSGGLGIMRVSARARSSEVDAIRGEAIRAMVSRTRTIMKLAQIGKWLNFVHAVYTIAW